jgi:glycine/D-amino acid oxidase-like deaminating enzyme
MSNPPPLSRVREFVVVGGGIAGCTVAYELARRGRDVTLLEQHSLAHAASGRNMGLLLNQVEPLPVRIMRTSIEIYHELEPLRSFSLRQVDQLLLAGDESQLATTTARMAAMRALDVDVEDVSGDQLRQVLPALSADIAGGAIVKGAWALDPAAATRAFADAARMAGAEIRTGVHVTGATGPGGVSTDGGAIAADAVILATGPWLAELAPAVPVRAATGWCMRTGQLTMRLPWIIEEMSWPEQEELGRAARPPSLGELAAGGYDEPVANAFALAPQPAGDALLGTSLAPSLVGAVEGVGMPQRLAQRALRVAPGLRELAVGAAWAAMRPMTPDGMPVCGAMPDGVWVHGGHGSVGMQAGPATARWLVDSILGGDPHPQLERLSPRRFSGGARRP